MYGYGEWRARGMTMWSLTVTMPCRRAASPCADRRPSVEWRDSLVSPGFRRRLFAPSGVRWKADVQGNRPPCEAEEDHRVRAFAWSLADAGVVCCAAAARGESARSPLDASGRAGARRCRARSPSPARSGRLQAARGSGRRCRARPWACRRGSGRGRREAAATPPRGRCSSSPGRLRCPPPPGRALSVHWTDCRWVR